jgi:aspartyl-tRNA(Asn)/glutamyl-tRNA(Gln) amidotransferase subunit B
VVELIQLLEAGKLNNITAKEIFREMVHSGQGATVVAKRLNKLIEQDSGEIDRVIAEVLAEFRDAAVADLRAGKQAALGFLVGQAMRKLRGKANPKELGPKIEAAVRGS